MTHIRYISLLASGKQGRRTRVVTHCDTPNSQNRFGLVARNNSFLYRQEESGFLVGDSRSNAGLIVGDWDSHLRHALGKRLQHCVQSSMRDADRRAALKLPRELIGAELNQPTQPFVPAML